MTYHEGVMKTISHQCMYGLETRDQYGVAPAYKPTSVLTNHPALLEVLQERCNGKHRHAQLIGKSACTQAARYPPRLCAAVVKGIQVIKKQSEMIKEARGSASTDVASAHWWGAGCPEDVLYELELEDMGEQDTSTWEDLANQRWQEHSQLWSETVDSTTGNILDPDKVPAGCDE